MEVRPGLGHCKGHLQGMKASEDMASAGTGLLEGLGRGYTALKAGPRLAQKLRSEGLGIWE